MSKTIYHYDPTTGCLVSTGIARESPLEPGVLLIPANATSCQVPETTSHEVAVFDTHSNSWNVMADWRKTPLFSTSDGSAVEITEIGKTPSDVGATEIPPPGRGYTCINGEWVIDPQQQSEILIETQRQRLAEIDAQLAAIDAASARPAREVALAICRGEAASAMVTAKLTELETQAAGLRAERKQLRIN